jgi:hypothetical protein
MRLAAEQGIGIHRRRLPPVFLRPEPRDFEMQVRRIRAGIAAGTDGADHLAAPQRLAFGEAIGIAVEVRVVVDPGRCRVEFVDRQAAAFAGEEFRHAAIAGGEHRRAARRHDVDRIVHAAFAARIGVGIDELSGAHARNRQQQTGRTDDRRHRCRSLRHLRRSGVHRGRCRSRRSRCRRLRWDRLRCRRHRGRDRRGRRLRRADVQRAAMRGEPDDVGAEQQSGEEYE